MINRWQLPTAILLFGAVLPNACAKQNPGDDSGGGGMGNIFGSGGNNGSGNASSSGAPAIQGYTGELAQPGTDGTKQIDATQAKAILSDSTKYCQGSAVEAEAAPAILEFVVDVSGSMKQSTPSTNGASKWDLTKAALKQVVSQLPLSVGVGMTFFPNMAVTEGTSARPVSSCVNSSSDVPIALADTSHVAAIQSAIDAIAVNPAGATPTYDAYSIALKNMRETTLTGNKYIVLITDGQPTQTKDCIGNGSECSPQPPEPVIQEIADAYKTDGISTFIVGSPGSEASACTGENKRVWLSQAATAGSTAKAGCSDAGPTYCHFDLSQEKDFGTALTKALFSITNSLLRCDYRVPDVDPSTGQKIEPGKVNMIYTDGTGGYFLILPGNGGCGEGWQYTDDSANAVNICGTTCNLFQNNPKATLTILFGCTSGSVPTPIL